MTNRAIITNALAQSLNKGDIKIDHQLSGKDHLMGRYTIADNDESDPNPYPAIGAFPLHSRGLMRNSDPAREGIRGLPGRTGPIRRGNRSSENACAMTDELPVVLVVIAGGPQDLGERQRHKPNG